MTAQTPEEFVYKGKRYLGLYTEPLNQYLQTHNIEFQAFISTCWRGYRGLWVISNNRLYLTDFSGAIKIYTTEKYELTIDESYDIKNISLNHLFPNQQKVFADWFSGEVKLVRRIKFTGDDYYDTVYKKVIHLTFEKGILINEEIIRNKSSFFPKWLRFW